MEQKFYTKGEEIFNAVTHGVGTALALAALVILIILSSIYGTSWHMVSFIIYGSTLVILYLGSTLYHSITNIKAKRLFRKFDHMSIYLLIAGTYTPYCLTVLRGTVGWLILGLVWACAIVGIVIKSFSTGKKDKLSTLLYIIMGWVIIVAFKPLAQGMSTLGIVFLILGGLAYTFGTLFYMKDKLKFNHGLWHLFVIAGSIMHFFSVLTTLNIS